MQSDRYQSPDTSNLVEQADVSANYSPSNDKCIYKLQVIKHTLVNISGNLSNRSGRSGSAVRSRLFMDGQEKADEDQYAQEEFERELNELQNREGVTQEEIDQFRRSAILKKSLDVVKLKANEMAAIRGSPARYNTVKSKVARNIKVKDKVVKKQKKAMIAAQMGLEESQSQSVQQDPSSLNYDPSLNVRQLGMSINQKGSNWEKTHNAKVQEKEDLIRQKELEIEALQDDIKQRRVRESLSPERRSSPTKVQVQNTEVKREEQRKPAVEDVQINVQITTQQANTNNQAVSQQQQQQQQQQPETKPQTMQVKSKKNAVSSGFMGGNQKPAQQVVQQQQPVVETQVQVEVQVQEQKQAPLPESKPTLPPNEEEYEEEDTFQQMASAHVHRKELEKDHKFYNQDLENKTIAMQEEFDSLLEQMMNNRQNRDTEGFYKIMDQYYTNEPAEKHESPTKRLISHKNSVQDHKKAMKDNIQRGDYSMTYCTEPGKSYIVEPKGGQINYDIVRKNPIKFYDQVFNQEIVKHKIKEEETQARRSKTQIQISSKVTTRPYLRIMQKIKVKLVEMLQQKMGLEFGKDILEAMDSTAVHSKIKKFMQQDKIQIVNQNNDPLYGEVINQVANVDSDDEESQQALDERLEYEDGGSPDFKKNNAKLHLQDDDLHDLEKEVRDVIAKQQSNQ